MVVVEAPRLMRFVVGQYYGEESSFSREVIMWVPTRLLLALKVPVMRGRFVVACKRLFLK